MEPGYVGVLIDNLTWKGIPSGQTRFEKIEYYELAARELNLIPCFFRLQDVKLKKGTTKAFVKDEDGYRLITVPIPNVIHNRAMYPKRQTRRKLDTLILHGKQVFNQRTRYGKLKVHQTLWANPLLRPFLPETALATRYHLHRLMKKFPSLILKPNSGSIGMGVMKLEKLGKVWELQYPKSRFGTKSGKIRFKSKLPNILRQLLRERRYLVQERIPLATLNQRPFDLRVTVQRGAEGSWKISGIAAKVAAKNKFVTNVAQGGEVYPLPELIKNYPELNTEEVILKISISSILFAQQLGESFPGLADVGLDIGINQFGQPYFIECNCRDMRVSFRKGNMIEQWKSTYRNPMEYAHYLLQEAPILH